MGLPALETNGRSHDTEALYREHQAAVARLCRSLLRDRAEAEDATQQVFLAAHRALLNGSAPREPLAWLLAVARHECYARFRQRTTTPVPTGDVPDGTTPDASAQVLRAGELATVWDEVGQLPRAQREAFLLREIRGLSYGQLAAELSLSTPSVRSLLLRARARLRHRLRDAAAGLGGAPWIQSLVRLVAGGDGASPVPAATKAAAVGLGALALVGGGGDLARAPHHLSNGPGHTATRHQAHARARRPATPAAAAVMPRENRLRREVRQSEPEHSQTRGDGSPKSSGSRDSGTSSGDGSSGSGRDGSGDTSTVAQPTTDGSGDGGSSTSTTSGSDGSGHGSSDGGSSGSSSGSDGGSDSTTTTTTTSSGSDGSGSDGSGSDGSGSSGRDGGGTDGG
jgi:RNA polymerase sigma factor (sigma-70 family)